MWGTFPTCLFFSRIWHVENVPHMFLNGLLAPTLLPQRRLNHNSFEDRIAVCSCYNSNCPSARRVERAESLLPALARDCALAAQVVPRVSPFSKTPKVPKCALRSASAREISHLEKLVSH